MNILRKKFSNGFEVELIAFYPQLQDWYITAEPETQQWLIDHVERDWICAEVGAHLGYTSMLLSTLGRHVYSFEASVKTANMFKKNLLHNESLLGKGYFDNVDLYVHPVGNNSGLMAETLWLTGADKTFGETHGEFVFVTLDEVLLRYNKVNGLDLIFIDADGWDYDVIMGAEECIKRSHPYIIMEANYALSWRGHTINDVKMYANKNGYEIKWLDEQCPGNLLLC